MDYRDEQNERKAVAAPFRNVLPELLAELPEMVEKRPEEPWGRWSLRTNGLDGYSAPSAELSVSLGPDRYEAARETFRTAQPDGRRLARRLARWLGDHAEELAKATAKRDRIATERKAVAEALAGLADRLTAAGLRVRMTPPEDGKDGCMDLHTADDGETASMRAWHSTSENGVRFRLDYNSLSSATIEAMGLAMARGAGK